MLVCILIAPLVGARLGWGPDLVALAQIAAPLSFANAISTPKGMLRLFGRFDLLTAHSTITPAIRLAWVTVLAFTGGSLLWYIIAWLIAGWGGAAVGFWFGWREAARRSMLNEIDGSMRRLAHRNSGVWRFSIFSNLNSSVALIPTQLAVLLVASLLGPAAAGVFRIAREVGTGMLKPVDVINQTIFPDMARLVATRNWRRLTRAAVRAGMTAAAVGLAVTLLILVAGNILIGLIFGKAFVAAVPILLLMAIGTSIRVLAFAADPIMYALGRPGIPLILSLTSALLFVTVMIWRLPIDGLPGAGWAFLAMGTMNGLLSALAAALLIKREQARDHNIAARGTAG
jgi:O-antigen/teichoic acid export membrane protein